MTTKEIDSLEIAFSQGATLSTEEKRRVIQALRGGLGFAERSIELALELKQVESILRKARAAMEAVTEPEHSHFGSVHRLKQTVSEIDASGLLPKEGT